MDGRADPDPGHTTVLEQRWFAGVHGSVGGGGTDRPEVHNTLSVLTREWIVDRAAHAGLAITSTPAPTSAWQGGFKDSYTSGFWGFLRVLPGFDPHVRPVRTSVEEQLDESVLNRWGWGRPPYRPKNTNLGSWVTQLSRTRSQT